MASPVSPSPARARALALLLLASAGCRGETERLDPGARGPPAAFDWARPEAALLLGADDAAARLGDLEQRARVSWVAGRGPDSRTISTVEQHRVRQLAGGEFEAESSIDPGGGPGAETGRTVVWAGGETYARSRWTEFRRRPTDRGAGARRFRDESFGLAGDVARLCGTALTWRPAGDVALLGRPARRFTLGLQGAAAPPPASPPGRSNDPETQARLALLEGASPLALEGEVALDAATGVPLSVKLSATFGLADDPALRVHVDVDARITALGGAVAAVRAPSGAKPDERKPDGPARALEAAGLRERRRPTAAEQAAPEEESAD